MASFSGIKNTLLAEQVEEQLYEYITKLPLKAGDKLPNEFKLAEMFGVGRSTVREAVKLLSSKGIVEVRRGSGTYVKDLVPTNLDPLNLRNVEDKVTLAMNLVDLRLILEPGIAELAAYNATDEEIEHLKDLCDTVEYKIEHDLYYIQDDIRQSLQDLGAACVSNHSTGDKRSLFVVLDKEHQVSDEDWQNMAIRDIERKYNIRIL